VFRLLAALATQQYSGVGFQNHSSPFVLALFSLA